MTDVDRGVFFTMAAVYGNHGLTKRGSGSATTAPGLYASDIINHAVSTWAPKLTIDIPTDTTFAIPQMEFRTPTTAAEIVKSANRFHLWDWGVWENKTFRYQARNSQRNWLARVGPSRLEQTGQIADIPNGVIVVYQDVDGTPKFVGPTGSGVDTESATLIDADTQIPANQFSPVIKRWAILDMGEVSTSAAAIQVGERFLAESKLINTAGRAELTGWVMDDKGVTEPYWKVRAGDTIQFLDAADTSTRRIVKTSKNHDSRAVAIDLDSPPEGMAALLERLGVGLVNLSARGAPTVSPGGETSSRPPVQI